MKSAKSLCLLSSILFLFASSVKHGYCQDTLSKSSFTLSANVPEFFIGDFSIYAEYGLPKKISLGGSAGIIVPVRSKQELLYGAYSVNDNLYPFWIYYGYAVRIYVKIYTERPGSYFSPLILYKNLHYSHYDFIDKHGHEEDFENYNRSETAQVFSFQLLWGRETVHRHFFIDRYIGFGLRDRIREYYTYSCYLSSGGKGSGPCTDNHVGPGSKNQVFPEFHLGVRMGYRK